MIPAIATQQSVAVAPGPTRLIECQGLSRRFGRTRALDDLTVALDAGEPIALVGPNGAGKTTLLSLLCGYLQPTAGTLRLFGHAAGATSLIGRIGVLPQDASLDPAVSIGRQLTSFARLQGYSASAAREEIERVLALVQLPEVGRQLPASLSHGMGKRVALAQALIGSPELVLLDEPTAGIDPPNVRVIRELVRALASTTTFIISSHNLDELERLCGSVVTLVQGRLTGYQPIADVDDAETLNLRLGQVPGDAFMQACTSLPGVLQVQVTGGQDEYSLRYEPGQQVEQALLSLLDEKGWPWRQLTRGRSLEERLYGQEP